MKVCSDERCLLQSPHSGPCEFAQPPLTDADWKPCVKI
jgi:hypothetical protein